MRLLEIARLTSMVAVAWAFLCAPPAHAYLDPGTGSFIFQILAASFLGAMATIKIWWGNVANLFKGKPKSGDSKGKTAVDAEGSHTQANVDPAGESNVEAEDSDKQKTGV